MPLPVQSFSGRACAALLTVLGLGVPTVWPVAAGAMSAQLLAQSPLPLTSIQVVNKSTLKVTLHEGEFHYSGILRKTTGNLFQGQDQQVRVLVDRGTGRIVVINVKTGDEFYNYIHKPAMVSSHSKAGDICLAAVAKVVGVPSSQLGVIKVQKVASGTAIDVRVPKAQAPWYCLIDSQGKAKDVYYKGSEGRL